MNQTPVYSPTALKCPQCSADLQPAPEGYTVCPYCGSSLLINLPPGQEDQPAPQPARANTSPGNPDEAAAESGFVKGYRFRMLSVPDPQGLGMEVFRMLIPVGWNVEGGVQWALDNPSMPATIPCRVSNPTGAEAFEILPNLNFTWRGGGMFSLSKKYFGAEIHPPMHIREAFRDFVLPRNRGQVRNLRILKEEPMPDLPRLAKSEAALLPYGQAEGGKIRVAYSLPGQPQPVEEELYGVVEVFRVPVQTLFSRMEVITWLIDALFSFRAAEGHLNSMSNLFGVMIRSIRANPQWYAAYKSVIMQLGRMQVERIHHIGQIGQIYANTGREIREQNLQDFYSRQATYERINTDWSRTIRDVDAFYDPNRGETVELPAGYGHAWANTLGEYIVTESSNFNPNIGSNLTWTEMNQK